MKFEFSLIVLTRNSQNSVEKNLFEIHSYLNNLDFVDSFEIIVSDYSEDNTFSILEELSEKIKDIHPVKAPRRGIGCGIFTGVEKSSFEYIMCYPIDMAWDISIIKESLKKLSEGYDVVLGSRCVSGSKTKRPFKRRIFSKAYNLLINLLFKLDIKDTQGTCAFKRSQFMMYKDNLTDDGPFLQTEILIYSKINNLKIIEIPSLVTDLRKDSTVGVFSFSISMLRSIIKKKLEITVRNHNNEK